MQILYNIILFYIIFLNIIFSVVPLANFFGYWDEFFETILIIFVFLNIFKNHIIKFKKEKVYIIALILCVIGIGILSNIKFEYTISLNAIIRDIVNFIKFPITFLTIQALQIDKKITKSINRISIKFLKASIAIIFVLGVISLFKDIGLSQNEVRYGFMPYQFLFSHPTYLVLCCVFLLAIFSSIGEIKHFFLYEMMLICIIFLSMRTKGIAIVATYIFIKYAGKWVKKIKVLYWGVVGVLIMIVAYDKLLLYNSYSSSPREVLYKGSFLLMKKCFPLGSGFSTFASHISGKFNSKVYNFIEIPYYWTEDGLGIEVLGDAGFPYYLGQFGIIGFILFLLICYYIYKIASENITNKLAVWLIGIYLIIALTTESILLNNGFEIAFILAVTSYSLKNKERIMLEKD